MRDQLVPQNTPNKCQIPCIQFKQGIKQIIQRERERTKTELKTKTDESVHHQMYFIA